MLQIPKLLSSSSVKAEFMAKNKVTESMLSMAPRSTSEDYQEWVEMTRADGLTTLERIELINVYSAFIFAKNQELKKKNAEIKKQNREFLAKIKGFENKEKAIRKFYEESDTWMGFEEFCIHLGLVRSGVEYCHVFRVKTFNASSQSQKEFQGEWAGI